MTQPYVFNLANKKPGKQALLFGLSCLFSGSLIAIYKNVLGGPPETHKNLAQENVLYYRPFEEKRDIYFFNWGPIMGQSAGRPKKE
ncbi:hypothetical protein FDP41_007845 [Naegleria fowleri]|uniref:Uncharacterized protein n=1 Tax=Naegleria fowleri TaxID=5763 RepID=A0A6A5CEC3_NAEFO|nr:uncharacterized protein FDP41_007845 [Naegleria fowleri]KAF0983930.1 hypothetical protein FDP41_007845 [Naegleria fowleri]CAG4710647.1 unnamed protein product [Naegleria fowleri]